MRSMMVAGNWKMNGSTTSITQLVADITADLAGKNDQHLEMVLFPPFVYLAQVEAALAGTAVALGAQNLDYHASGAYTGEISGVMLVDFNCQYVLTGHSERRSLYLESDEVVAQKCIAAAQCGLKPVLCVGETLEQRQQDKTLAVITQQLTAVLGSAEGLKALQKGVIAYEPVWAIGTGVTANPEQAQEVHQLIREYVAEYDSNLAKNIRIIYGGSVKADNARELFAMPDVDGGLVGGASLHAQDFLKIYLAAEAIINDQ